MKYMWQSHSKIWASLTLLALITSCATPVGSLELNETRKSISQKKTGCPKSEITLDAQTDNSWTAVCRGKRFLCEVNKTYHSVNTTSTSGTLEGIEQTCVEEIKN
jgi:hypothetical protein